MIKNENKMRNTTDILLLNIVVYHIELGEDVKMHWLQPPYLAASCSIFI